MVVGWTAGRVVCMSMSDSTIAGRMLVYGLQKKVKVGVETKALNKSKGQCG